METAPSSDTWQLIGRTICLSASITGNFNQSDQQKESPLVNQTLPEVRGQKTENMFSINSPVLIVMMLRCYANCRTVQSLVNHAHTDTVIRAKAPV